LAYRLRGKVGTAQALPLEPRKPLRDLMHPRAMDRGAMADKARLTRPPLPYCFAVLGRDIVADHVERRNRRGTLCLKQREAGDKLALAFPALPLPVDTSRACSTGGKQVQRPLAPIGMFNAVGAARLRRCRRLAPWPRRQRGFVIEALHPFLRLEGRV
jgi:hypothetical protein